MAKGPIAAAGSILGWVVVVAIVVAIMILWNWDPIAFITNTIQRIANVFLGWELFRKIAGVG